MGTRTKRKAARPSEIIDAALHVFSEKGFAAARLDDIASRAGLSKGALYLYFETKEALFAGVVQAVVQPNVERVRAAMAVQDVPFAEFVAGFVLTFADVAERSPVGPIAKMVVGESRNFPELARLWHDEVVAPMVALLTEVVRRAQDRGEARPGHPRYIAMQLVAPFLLGVIWRETFTPVGADSIDFAILAQEHARSLAEGIFFRPTTEGAPR
jgi:AcrR family transcriptional regulator